MKVLIITAYIEGDSSKVKNIAAAFSPDCLFSVDFPVGKIDNSPSYG